MGSSQQVLELKPVDLGALGSLNDCGVSQPLRRMEGARNRPDYQVRALLSRLLCVLSCLWQANFCALQSGFGVENDVMIQQLDSISSRRRRKQLVFLTLQI